MHALVFLMALMLGAADIPAPPHPALPEARALSDRGEYPEAARRYREILTEAVAAGDCATVVPALEGLRTTAYWGRAPELLDAVDSPAMWDLMEGQPSCGSVVLVQLYLGYKQTRQADRAAALLDTAEERLTSPGFAKYLTRIKPLVTESVHAEMTPVYMEGASEFDAEDWAAAFPVVLDREGQVVSGGDTWTGPGDLSADVRLGRMAENFYFRIEVADEHHLTVGSQHDEVVLTFDASQGSGSIFRRDPQEAENPYVVRVSTAPTTGPESIPSLNRAWRTARCTDDGYVMIVCLPKGSLGDIEVTAGNRYAMDVLIRDVDGAGESILRWMGLSTDPEALYWAGVLAIQ